MSRVQLASRYLFTNYLEFHKLYLSVIILCFCATISYLAFLGRFQSAYEKFLKISIYKDLSQAMLVLKRLCPDGQDFEVKSLRYRLCYLVSLICSNLSNEEEHQFWKFGQFNLNIIFLIQALFRICISTTFLLKKVLVRLLNHANSRVFTYFLQWKIKIYHQVMDLIFFENQIKV